MRDLKEQGLHHDEIARKHNRDQSTVSRHCSGYCTHAETALSMTETTPEQVTTALNALANEIQCIPTREDWDHWDGRCCASATVMNMFGDWQSAVAAADLPTVASHAPRAVRDAVFDQPELARGYDD